MTPREYFDLFRERWRCVLAGLALGVLGAAGYLLITPSQYEANVTLFVSAGTATDPTAALDRNTLSADRMQTYVRMITSPRVANEVVETLELPTTGDELAGRITASADPETVLLTATATDQDPVRAAEIANVLADEFVDQVAEIEAPADGSAAAVVSARVFQDAVPPDSPSAPQPGLVLPVGILLGLLAGFAFAVLRRAFDTSVRTRRDLARAVGVPVLGVLARRRGAEHFVVRDEPSSIAAESYRRIRAGLQPAGGKRVVLLTAASSGDGTTTAVANLALAAAETGRRVLVVEADLRRPRVADLLEGQRSTGLTDVLRGARLGHVVRRGMAGIDVVGSGQVPANPGGALASPPVAPFFDEARRGYDLVLVDAPPLLPVADAGVLAPLADAVVLVVSSGTPAARVGAARDALEASPTPLVGAVLTMARSRVVRSDEKYASAAPVAPAPASGPPSTPTSLPVRTPPQPVRPVANGATTKITTGRADPPKPDPGTTDPVSTDTAAVDAVNGESVPRPSPSPRPRPKAPAEETAHH